MYRLSMTPIRSRVSVLVSDILCIVTFEHVLALYLQRTLIPFEQASLGCSTAAFVLASTARPTRMTEDRIEVEYDKLRVRE